MNTVIFNSTSVKTNRPFGLGILKSPKGRKPAKPGLHPGRLPIGANPEDSAWDDGYRLGIEAILADAPDTLSPFCRDAWLAGFEAGTLALETERNGYLDGLASEYDATIGRLEECEMRGAWGGHDDSDSASSFADDFYAAMAHEG